MKYGKFRWLAMTPCFFAVACGAAGLTEPKTNPVIEDSIKTSNGAVLGTLATTAERRLVLVPLAGKHVGKFCAEPSPDAAESLVASFKASLEASGKAENSAEAKLKSEFARSLATSAGSLTKRSQGLQMFRDGVFALCQARMNEFLTDAEFVEQTWRLRQEAGKLIDAEIRQPNWNAVPTITIIEAPTAVDQPVASSDTTGAG